jgi:putative intracellular protease/amidase
LLTGSTVSAIGGEPTSGESVEYGIVLAMHVLVLAMQGAFDLGLSALLDTLGTANQLASAIGVRTAAINVTVVGVRRRVHTAHGFRVPLVATATTRPDAVLLPALGEKMPSTLAERLAHRDVADAGGVLREWSQGGAWIGAACTGTFVLADSTLLDGHDATTSWWLAPLFRQRYSNIELDESRMLVSSGAFVTAGAALAHIDLALGLIRRQSLAVALRPSGYEANGGVMGIFKISHLQRLRPHYPAYSRHNLGTPNLSWTRSGHERINEHFPESHSGCINQNSPG